MLHQKLDLTWLETSQGFFVLSRLKKSAFSFVEVTTVSQSPFNAEQLSKFYGKTQADKIKQRKVKRQFLDYGNDMKGVGNDASILHRTEGLHKVWDSLRH